jgi:hypothetical protein
LGQALLRELKGENQGVVADFGDLDRKVAVGRKGGSKKDKGKRDFRIYFREMNDLENS